MSNPARTEPETTATDSPWFWISLFCAGALMALVLMGPKFSWRQPQLERKFQARERSGHTVSAREGPSEFSTSGKPMLTLAPLYAMLSGGLFVSWLMWMRQRFLDRRLNSIECKDVDS